MLHSVILVAAQFYFTGVLLGNEAPAISICEAISISKEKLKSASKTDFLISSVKLIHLDDGSRAWRVQYGSDFAISETDPHTSYRIFKYVVVNMNGSSEYLEKKGIPRKRVGIPSLDR